MPPKKKYEREQIVSAAVEIVRTEGIKALSARSLAKKMGSSACPIFTVFENMDEVTNVTIKEVRKIYDEYIREGLQDSQAFKGVGEQYIRFAIDEPKLFQLLFMSEQREMPTADSVLPIIDENYNEILLSVERGYGLNEDDALWLYRHLWIYSHGIAVLCATKMCFFTQQTVSELLKDEFIGMLKKIKGEKND